MMALEKAKASNPDLAQKIIPDYVHPGPSGHLLMAGALLKTWQAPSIVTDVEIEAGAKKVARAQNTKVAGLEESGGTVRWIQADQALPMPVDMNDPVTALAVNSSDFVQALDEQPLKVTGLKEGTFVLKIDGSEVGKFSSEQLAHGVNLALIPTPMFKQAQEVHKLTLQHNEIHFVRWRQVQVRAMNADHMALEKALDGLDALEEDIVKKQRAAAQPVEHKYELMPL